MWWLALACAVHRPPVPQFSADYEHPERHLAISPDVGAATVRRIAAEIPAGTDEQRLLAIGPWIDAHLRYDADAAYRWRDADRLLLDGTFGGCADHAMLYGSVARALGIPTLWVKSLDGGFIRAFQASNGEVQQWTGHVYLEVFLDHRWVLFDATEGKLLPEYKVDSPQFPKGRWAYDVGDDPHQMILSTQWEEWKDQTRGWIDTFDAGQLPPPQCFPKVAIVADSPHWQHLGERIPALNGEAAESFNTEFERLLPRPQGESLIVVAVGERWVLPAALWRDYTGMSIDEFRAYAAGEDAAGVDHRAADGTEVRVIWGRDDAAASSAIDQMRSLPCTPRSYR